jgi:hypothetical protein
MSNLVKDRFFINTKNNIEIDVTEWAETIKSNLQNGRKFNEQTPFGVTADGGYFWWDEETNPDLDKKSVNALIERFAKLEDF